MPTRLYSYVKDQQSTTASQGGGHTSELKISQGIYFFHATLILMEAIGSSPMLEEEGGTINSTEKTLLLKPSEPSPYIAVRTDIEPPAYYILDEVDRTQLRQLCQSYSPLTSAPIMIGSQISLPQGNYHFYSPPASMFLQLAEENAFGTSYDGVQISFSYATAFLTIAIISGFMWSFQQVPQLDELTTFSEQDYTDVSDSAVLLVTQLSYFISYCAAQKLMLGKKMQGVNADAVKQSALQLTIKSLSDMLGFMAGGYFGQLLVDYLGLTSWTAVAAINLPVMAGCGLGIFTGIKLASAVSPDTSSRDIQTLLAKSIGWSSSKLASERYYDNFDETVQKSLADDNFDPKHGYWEYTKTFFNRSPTTGLVGAAMASGPVWNLLGGAAVSGLLKLGMVDAGARLLGALINGIGVGGVFTATSVIISPEIRRLVKQDSIERYSLKVGNSIKIDKLIDIICNDFDVTLTQDQKDHIVRYINDSNDSNGSDRSQEP